MLRYEWKLDFLIFRVVSLSFFYMLICPIDKCSVVFKGLNRVFICMIIMSLYAFIFSVLTLILGDRV